MSRHRNVRSMNYSEEYEGFDDVYGHSVEDDYCISPSDAGFLFDRTRQPQMSAFLNEENDIAEEEEGEEEATFVKPQLTDLEEAKLRSCVDEIQNVIGDMLPQSTIEELVLKFNFDMKLSLDNALNHSEAAAVESVPGDAKPRERKPKPRDKDEPIESSSMYLGGKSNTTEPPMLTTLRPSGGDNAAPVNTFVIPKLKKAQVKIPVHDVADDVSPQSFSSLQLLINQYRETETDDTRDKPARLPLTNIPSSLAEMSESLGFGVVATEQKGIPLKIPKLKPKTPAPEDSWVIDLSSALNPLHADPPQEVGASVDMDVELEPKLALELPHLETLVVSNTNLRASTSSAFGKVLCRHWKCRKLVITKEKSKWKVSHFKFSTPSPDDLILKHLRRK